MGKRMDFNAYGKLNVILWDEFSYGKINVILWEKKCPRQSKILRKVLVDMEWNAQQFKIPIQSLNNKYVIPKSITI